MIEKDQRYQLSVRAWEFRKQMGFSKSLPEDIRLEAVSSVSVPHQALLDGF